MAISRSGKIGLTGTFEDSVDFDLDTSSYFLDANSGHEIFIAQYDTNANLQWVKQLDGDDDDTAGDIAYGPADQLAVSGQLKQSAVLDIDPDTLHSIPLVHHPCSGCGYYPHKFVIRLDSSGTLISHYSLQNHSVYSSSERPGMLRFNSKCEIVYATNGGQPDNSTGLPYFNLRWIDQSGQVTNAVDFLGTNFGLDKTAGLEIDHNDNVYVVFEKHSGCTYPDTNDTLLSLCNVNPAGFPFRSNSSDGYRYFLTKYSSTGAFEWSHWLGDNNNYSLNWPYYWITSTVTDLEIVGEKLLVSGQHLLSLDFDPDSLGQLILTNIDTSYSSSPWTYEGFIVQYDFDGNAEDAWQVSGWGHDGNVLLSNDPNGNVIATAEFEISTDKDINPGLIDSVYSNGDFDLLITKFHLGSGIQTATLPDTTTICEGEIECFTGESYFQSQPIDTIISYNNNLISGSTYLNVIPTIHTNQSMSLCNGQSVQIAGQLQNSSGSYPVTYTSLTTGCDSVHTINLTVFPNSNDTIIYTGCEPFSGPNGTVYTSSGVYSQVMSNTNGCDSIIVMDLTIGKESSGGEAIHLCKGEGFEVGGIMRYQSGIYHDTLVNASGCDSLRTIYLAIHEPFTEKEVDLCEGESVFAGGALQDHSGIYIDTLSSFLGCDSIVQTVVTKLEINEELTISGNTIKSKEPGATGFQWIDCNTNTILEGETFYRLTVQKSGSFKLAIEKQDCRDTSICVEMLIDTISIEPNPNDSNDTIIVVPPFFPPIDSQLFDLGEFAVYPNPFNQSFIIEFPIEGITGRIYLINSLGQPVLEQQLLGDQIVEVAVPHAAGVYSLIISTPLASYRKRMISINRY